MGIVNVTPDSFSDGGRYLDVAHAVDHALALRDAGADVVDIGGESTRPGAADVDTNEEIARVVPVIAALRAQSDVVISVDTSKAAVARAAIDAGADIVNDVGALAWDPAMPAVCVASGVGVVLMHTPAGRNERHASIDDAAIVPSVAAILRQRVAAAIDAGVPADRIVVDPGFGFGKTAAQNHELLGSIEQIVGLGWPVLVGVSRKRMIREVVGTHAADIEAATVAAHVFAALRGAAIVRTHDVSATVAAFGLLRAITRPTPETK